MITSPVIPAIIPQDEAHITTLLATLGQVAEVHIDVVDGVFVPAVSWPYTPTGNPAALASVLAPYTVEVDLMVADPLTAAKAWVAAGADMLVFHVETLSVAALEVCRDTYDVTIGIAALSDTPIETLIAYAPYADYVQVMGIAHIGVQGEAFDARAITRIEALHDALPTHFLSIDGSVNPGTIPQLRELGLSRFIVGSAIVQHESPRRAYLELTNLVSSTGKSFSS